jgi:hypothetical protein
MSNYHNQQIMDNPIQSKEKEYKSDFELGILDFEKEKTVTQRIIEQMQSNIFICDNCYHFVKNGLFAFKRCSLTNCCVSKNTKACSRFKR